GKLDRRALPNPGRTRPTLNTRYTPPRNAVESQLTEIWSQLLGVDSVGVLDSFFELGGHSLSYSALISRVVREMQIEAPAHSLFECYTVASMADRISGYQRAELGRGEVGRLLDEVSSLSDDEARRALRTEATERGGRPK